MSTTTKNYSLKKPEQEDFYNIDDFNENADIIDAQLKTLSDEVEKVAQNEEVVQINRKVGSTADSGGSSAAGSIFAKLNKVISDIETHMGRWTSTRAGHIDTINTNATNVKNYTVTNNTANKTGVLSQKLSYLINLLENGTYGLNVLRNTAKYYVIGSSGMTSETIAKNVNCTAVASSNGALFVGKWVPKHDGRVIARISLTRTASGTVKLYTATISNSRKPIMYDQSAVSGSTDTTGRFSPMFDADGYTAGTILTDVKYPTSFEECVSVYSPGKYDVLFDVEAGKPITFWAKKDSNITYAEINIMYKEV